MESQSPDLALVISIIAIVISGSSLVVTIATLLRRPKLKVVSVRLYPRMNCLEFECTHIGSWLGYSGVCDITIKGAVFDETTCGQRLKFWQRRSPQDLDIYVEPWHRIPHPCYPDPAKISVGDTSKFSVYTHAIWNWEEMSSCEKKMRDALPKKTSRIGIRDSLGRIHWADRKTTDGIRKAFCQHIEQICREAEQTRNRSAV